MVRGVQMWSQGVGEKFWGVSITSIWAWGDAFSPVDPSNQRVTRNVAKYEKLLATHGDRVGAPLQRPNVTQLQNRDAYEELCQGLGAQVGLAMGYHSPHLITGPIPMFSPSLLSPDGPGAALTPWLLL